MTDFTDLPPDQQAIGKTLLTLLRSFVDRDADALLAVYSEDADCVNAFGTVKRGRAEHWIGIISRCAHYSANPTAPG